jgi:hypothetical protein
LTSFSSSYEMNLMLVGRRRDSTAETASGVLCLFGCTKNYEVKHATTCF